MRSIFFGTPAIAVPALRALAGISDVALVVCQPDRPAGRGLTLRAPPVKEAALELGIQVEQPTKIRPPAFSESLRALRADVAVVMAYGRILPKSVLEAPKHGCLNLHASILPKYRGAAPINWAIVRGETETGISLMQMDEGCDTGAVFSVHTIPIGPSMDAGELYEQIAALGAKVIESDLARALDGTLVATPQDGANATEAPMLKKEDGIVDFSRSAPSVHDCARGMNPWPGATTMLDGKRLKLLKTRVVEATGVHGEAGTVLVADRGRIEIACGTGIIALMRGQLEGRKPLEAKDLVAGRTIQTPMRLGS